MPQELSGEEPTQRGGCVIAACPGVQHTQEKKGKITGRKAFDLCSEVNHESAKLASSFCTLQQAPQHILSQVVLIVPHACVVREEDSPA